MKALFEEPIERTSAPSDPWGQERDLEDIIDGSLSFEDSFCSENPGSELHNELNPSEKSYVPLDDSKQYLAGLEKKLACLQGKTLSKRTSRRKQLIDALVSSKDCQNHNLLHTQDSLDAYPLQLTDSSDLNCENKTLLNPQGPLGSMVRRIAPEKVALSEEELCELLKADLLGRQHELIMSESTPHDSNKEELDISNFSVEDKKL